MRVACVRCALRPEKGRSSCLPDEPLRPHPGPVVRAGGAAALRRGAAWCYARPSFSAAATASTGTVTGWGAPATAQSGSLSPLPVTVQTIF